MKRVVYTTKRKDPRTGTWRPMSHASVCEDVGVEEIVDKMRKLYDKDVANHVWPEGMFDSLCQVVDMENEMVGVSKAKPSGLILDDAEALSKLPDFELLFGGEGKEIDWTKYNPKFRNQGASWLCTGFAGCTIGSIFEKYENDHDIDFSPAELFYRAGGGVNGNSLISTAGRMTEGFVLEEDVPTPYLNSWGYGEWLDLKKKSTATKEMLDAGKQYRMKGFANVRPNDDMMRIALRESPLYVAIGIGSGYWAEKAKKPSTYSAYHAGVLMGLEVDGTRIFRDSLQGYPNFDGIHKLDKDYPILYALSFVDLPNDWQDYQKKTLNEMFEPVLNHYGLKRDFQKEVYMAQSLKEVLKHHPTLPPYIGKEWTVCINALAYGGYSYQDLLNHYTNIRRTGKPIFNLNEPR